jgi:hypothetical protein
MANVFILEWTEDRQRQRGRVELGNFDGNVQDAQRWIDGNWHIIHPERSSVKVISVFGAGTVEKVTPDDKPGKLA